MTEVGAPYDQVNHHDPTKKTLKKAYFKGVGEGGYMDPVVNRVINNPMKK